MMLNGAYKDQSIYSSKDSSDETKEVLYAKDFVSFDISDGDTIVFKKKNGERERVRLVGIDAPEKTQPSLTEGKNCGELARNFLKSLIGPDLYCEISGKDQYERKLGTCFSKGLNLNREMVIQGYAVAYVYYSKTYKDEENEARKLKRGLWKYGFQEPSKYRKEQKKEVPDL